MICQTIIIRGGNIFFFLSLMYFILKYSHNCKSLQVFKKTQYFMQPFITLSGDGLQCFKFIVLKYAVNHLFIYILVHRSLNCKINFAGCY